MRNYLHATAGTRVCSPITLLRYPKSYASSRRRQGYLRQFTSQTSLSHDPWFLLADVHIGDKTLPRLNTFFNGFFFHQFEAHRPSHVLFLGDTFHLRGGTDPAHHRFFTDILGRIITAPWSPQCHLLVGNHDMKNRFNRQDNSVYPFRLVSGRIHVYAEPTITTLDNYRSMFVPFHNNEKAAREYIATNSSLDTIVFYHGPLVGARMNTQSLCADAEISPRNLASCKRAFLGHFHTHGPVGGASRVIYVGSPIQSNMGDAGDTARGLVCYWPNSDSWELFRNPYAEYFVKVSWENLDQVDSDKIGGKKVQVLVDTQVPLAETAKARERLYTLGADMVETKFKSSPEPLPIEAVLPGNDGSETPASVTLGDTLHDMVDSFMATRNASLPSSAADSNAEATGELEEQRKAFFLDFIKPLQQRFPQSHTTGSVFHGDLVSIHMHNFRGLKGSTRLDLDRLPPSEVFLVSGANGSGKSTIIESIVWCLFGEFIAGKRNAVPTEEISFNNADECFVRLNFRNGYSFERSRTGKARKKLVAFKIIKPDGRVEEHGHDAASNTTYLCENILHMDLSMFKQLVVIGDNAEYFIRSAGEKGRTECLDTMFGLDFFEEIRDELSVMLKDLQLEILNLTGSRRELTVKITDNTQQWESRKTEIRHQAQLEERLKVEAVDFRAKVNTMRPKRQTLDSICSRLYSKLEAVDVEKRQVSTSIQTFTHRHRQYRAAAKNHENHRAKREQFVRQQLLEERKARELQDRPLQVLLTLFVKLWTKVKSFLGATPSHDEKSLRPSTPSPEPPFYDREIHEYIQKKAEAVSDALSNLQSLLQEVLHREREIYKELREPTSQAKRLDQTIASLENRISSAEGQLRLIASQKSVHQEKLTEFSNNNSKFRQSLLEVEAELEKQEHKQYLGTFWKGQLQDSERTKGAFLTHCRSAYVAHINTLIPSILSELCADSEHLLSTEQLLGFYLTADFRLLPSSGGLSLTRRSRGQLTRTYLALFLAMFVTARARIPFRPQFVFMDEVIDALDEAGMEGLKAWLATYLKSEGGRAFLLTHREAAGGRVIEVVKQKGGETLYRLRE